MPSRSKSARCPSPSPRQKASNAQLHDLEDDDAMHQLATGFIGDGLLEVAGVLGGAAVATLFLAGLAGYRRQTRPLPGPAWHDVALAAGPTVLVALIAALVDVPKGRAGAVVSIAFVGACLAVCGSTVGSVIGGAARRKHGFEPPVSRPKA